MQRHRPLKHIIMAGFFAAIAIVFKTYFAVTTLEFRFTFYDIPLFLSGMLLGPGLGLIIGFVTDWIYVLLHPFAFSFNLMTVSTMLWGFVGGIFYFKRDHPVKVLPLFLIIASTSIIVFTLNSIQLYVWFGPGMIAQIPIRLITLIIKWPIQVYVIHFMQQRVLSQVIMTHSL